jgi:dihydrofolate reductase
VTRRVLFFMMVSANGFYERARWEIDWHVTDAEFNDFAIAQLDSVDTLLFGRVTYEGMASYWPTPEAVGDDPEVARRMNALRKIVFSRTLDRAEWNNTSVVRGDAAERVGELKREPGKDAILMGSSDLAVALADRDLIDEYRLMVAPVALGHGKPVLDGLDRDLRLQLHDVRRFANGNVLLSYRPDR